MLPYSTEQENFWAGNFGVEYIERNKDESLIMQNVILFGKILKCAPNVKSIVELGCNIGLNLQALHRINRNFKLCGYEINGVSALRAQELNIADVYERTILDELSNDVKYDVSFTKLVLIHINPKKLDRVYQNLYNLSSRYIVVCEYYSPYPTVVEYRGAKDKLFKRDFAGELIDKYGLRLIDYGFSYHRDNYFPQGDFTWFLLEK